MTDRTTPTPSDGASVQLRGGAASPAPDPAAAVRSGADLVWTALHDPTLDRVEQAVRALGLPAGLVAESRADAPAAPPPEEPARRRRARLLEQDGATAVVLLPAAYDPTAERVHLGVLTVVVGDGAVLSVSRGAGPDLDPVRRALGGHLRHGGQLLERLVAAVVEGYDVVLEGLDDDVADVEGEVFSDERRSHARRIYRLKRETLQLQRAVAPLGGVVARLDVSATLHERVLRVGEHVDRLDKLLDSVLDADLAQVGVRQNEDQRRISAWAAIALVPTIVAGIYGMNFQHMPELAWRYGYPAALGLVVVVCTTLFVTFRRNGWLGTGRRTPDDGV